MKTFEEVKLIPLEDLQMLYWMTQSQLDTTRTILQKVRQQCIDLTLELEEYRPPVTDVHISDKTVLTFDEYGELIKKTP